MSDEEERITNFSALSAVLGITCCLFREGFGYGEYKLHHSVVCGFAGVLYGACFLNYKQTLAGTLCMELACASTCLVATYMKGLTQELNFEVCCSIGVLAALTLAQLEGSKRLLTSDYLSAQKKC